MQDEDRLRCVVVVGSGLMAPGIAAASAAAGLETRVAARNSSRAHAAAERATALAGVSVAHGSLEAATFEGCDLVLETVVEDIAVKRSLLRRIEAWVSPSALMVTNTSSLAIGDVAAALEAPHRFAGLHFLNPAHLTAVVEVVAGPATSPAAIEAVSDVARRLGKRPLVLRRDVPGFIWNRLQFAVLRECLHLVDEGVTDIASVDAALAEGLAPRWLVTGPLGTADLGGLGTFRVVARRLFPTLSAATEVSPQLARRADAGRGFYRWTPEARRSIEALRAEALAYQRELGPRRARAMPPPADSDGREA